MTKRFKQKINSVFSITNITLMILQSFMPGIFAFMPSTAFAAGVKDIGKVDLEFSQDSNEFDLSVVSNHDLKYVISYDEINLDLENGITGIATSKEGVATTTAYSGTCSGDDCIPDKVTTGVLELPSANFESSFIVDENVLWLIDGNNAIVPTVNLDTIYSAPQNNEVKVTFTKLPDNPGSLIIEEIQLSDEVAQQIGAYSKVAYDITSDMEDGTFEYELKLPLPEGADENAGLVYAESVEELSKAVAVENEVFVDDMVVAKGLDHFTVFVITDDQAIYSAPWIDYATQGYLNTGVHYPTNVVAGETATWNFSTLTPGTYGVYVSWSTHSNRTTSAPYDLTHTADVEHKNINQEQLADQSTIGVSAEWSGWYYYGSYDLDAVSNLVLTGVDNSSGTDYVIADEVLLVNVAIAPSIVWVDDDYGLNLNNDNHVWGYDAFSTIGDAVLAVSNDGEVIVKDGSYDGGIVLVKSVNLYSENGKDTTIIHGDGTLPFSVKSDNVTIDGFTITNATGTNGLITSDNSNLVVKNNRFTNIKSGTGNVHAVAIISGSEDVSNITIDSNMFDDIGYFGTLTTGYSASAVAIGWSNGTTNIDSVHIMNNMITDINSEGPIFLWKQSKGAYGIIINNGSDGSGGTTSNLFVENNTISNIEGLWAHGIGLEGPTPNAIVKDNTLSNLVDYKNPSDSIGIFFEANPAAGSVTVEKNSFSTSMGWGVVIHSSLSSTMPSLVVNASKNWWGDVTGPSTYGPGIGVAVGPQIKICPWLTTSDINNPTYGGGCLSYIQGRTFIDQENNGLLLSADGDHPHGRENGFTVRAYDNDWRLIEEKTTSSTNNLAQYRFKNLLDEDTTYRVCGVQREGYVESVPELGQHPVKSNGKNIPKKYSDAVIVTNASSATDEFSRCWETTLSEDDDGGAYLGIGYKIATPVQTGYNVNDGDDYATPRNPNELACTGGVTNINGISVHWTEVGDETSNVKYQRQYNVNGSSNWSGNEIYTNPYTNYRSFGGGAGSEATYGSRVRAWLDTNNNGVVDSKEAISEWSNTCEVTYDKTAPAVPTGLRRLAREDHSVVFACGDSAQIRHMHPDWDDNEEADFSHYEYSSFNANGGQGINERRFDDSIFEYNGSWLPGEGTYGFAVRAVDKAGNKSAWALGGGETLEDSCKITYDGTAPEATIDAIKYSNGTVEPTKFVTNYSTPTILGTASDDNNGVLSVVLTVNAIDYIATVNGNDWEVDITNSLPNGNNNMVLTVKDNVGNTTTINRDIFIDTVAPTAMHTYYQDGSIIINPIAYAQTLGAFTFTGEYLDSNLSSNLYWDSYVIFQAQDDHSFRFSNDGKKSYCGWRSTPNLVDMTSAISSAFSLTTQASFTNCVSTIEDGEYYMAHHIYDTATRKDIPSINQFRDVLGLHFIIDTVDPTSIITTFDLENEGETQTKTFDGLIQGTATDTPIDTASGVAKVLLEIMHTSFGKTESSYWNGSDWQTGFAQVTATGTTEWDYQIQPEEKVLEGTYVVVSHAVDNAGNIESTYKITIVFDKTIPEVTLTIDPVNPDGNNSWYVTEPTVTLTANDNYNVDYIEYQWNSTAGTWTKYSSPINPPGEGQNILYYRSVDLVGNVSELGVKEVKFDKTAPTDGSGNLKVRNIKSTTADASWNKPENSDDIVRFVLIWKHEDGKTRSTSVNGDVYEAELYDLFDGEWELTLESQDSAGHAYIVKEKFRVGEDPDAGSVLGAIDDATTGFIAGVSNFITGDSKDKAEETKEQKDSENKKENSDDAGSVLGDSDSECVTWKYYLPLFLLLIQLMFAASLEIANRDPGKKKLMIALGISILIIASFHILRNIDCYAGTTGLIQTLAKWFVPISIVLAMVFRWLGSMTVEEK